MIAYSINTQPVSPGLAAHAWLHLAATWEAAGFAYSL